MTLHSILLVAHLFGMVLGIGAATAADLMILRRGLFQPIKAGLVDVVADLSEAVSVGLVLLWISGIGLATESYLHNPGFIGNEKFWAKVAIVAMLSANAFVIHGAILPNLRHQIGKKLFSGLGKWSRINFIVAAALSGVSWYLPMVLGATREWSYVVPFTVIWFSYVGLLVAGAGAIAGLMWLSDRQEASQMTLTPAE